MKIAIMQPYLFPYLGYFQLIQAADKFVIYDDVTFIKQGWINRNTILLNKQPFLFSVPLKNASSYKLIRDTEVNSFSIWRTKFFKTLEQAYGKAPYCKNVTELIAVSLDKEASTIAAVAFKALTTISAYLGIETVFVETSSGYGNQHLQGAARVIDICRREGATQYINPIGGLELYSKENFREKNIKLNFLQPETINYRQFNNDFVSHLSIIDVMMFNSPDKINQFLTQYRLV